MGGRCRCCSSSVDNRRRLLSSALSNARRSNSPEVLRCDIFKGPAQVCRWTLMIRLHPLQGDFHNDDNDDGGGGGYGGGAMMTTTWR